MTSLDPIRITCSLPVVSLREKTVREAGEEPNKERDRQERPLHRSTVYITAGRVRPGETI
jgi:hypothetical protein